ncbi:nucleoside recognition protein [Ruminococcus sp.]|uniref:nucleoside recognition protein n=1 Tax=Ruminococcus sp. TaxID=41978 RepID=UPI0025E67E55|nr:nucleoside recognition protein [Ruminococcus sp.]MBQ8965333.1 nucleoside recognition protein [Ruminococcus sp.]
MKNKFPKLKGYLLCIALVFIMAGFALCPEASAAAVNEAVSRCLNVLIPSLFAFMAVTSMLVQSGSAALLAKPFSFISRKLFRMPDKMFTVMLISCVAGYPIGIKMLSDMLERGETDKNTAERAACFCYCGGPAFYSGAVGMSVFGNKQVGTLIFLSVLIPNILLAFILCRTSELHVTDKPCSTKGGNILVNSITSAGRSMGIICMTVIFISAVMALLEHCGALSAVGRIFGLDSNGLVLLKSFIEITSLTELSGCPYKLLPCICAACSFGGLCIIMQLFALKSERLSLFSFIKLRGPAAVLSAVFCKILQKYLVDDSVFVIYQNKTLFKINNFTASICLIMMIFLLNFKKSLVFSK